MSTKLKVALTILFFFAVQVCEAKSQSKDGLALRIALPQESVCLPSKSLKLELYVTNVGPTEISVSPDWIFSSIDYEVAYDIKKGFGRAAIFGQRGDSIVEFDFSQGSPVKLVAGSALRFASERALDYYDFFQQSGFYKVRAHYRGAIREQGGTLRTVWLDSNWVLFEVKECRP